VVTKHRRKKEGGRSVNISLSMPAALLKQIDKRASELGLTRSVYFRILHNAQESK